MVRIRDFIQRGWGRIRASVVPAVLFPILTGGEPAAWLVGAPALVAAALLRARAAGAHLPRVRVSGLLPLAPVFVVGSIRGALDVGWRVLRSPPRIDPGLASIPVELGEGPRNVLVGLVNVMPGTVTVALDAHGLTAHVVDRRADHAAELGRLVERTRSLFTPPPRRSRRGPPAVPATGAGGLA